MEWREALVQHPNQEESTLWGDYEPLKCPNQEYTPET